MNGQQRAITVVVSLTASSIVAMVVVSARALSVPDPAPQNSKRSQTPIDSSRQSAWLARAPEAYRVIGQRSLFQSSTAARLDEKPAVIEKAEAEVAAPANEPRPRTPLDDRVAAVGIVQMNGAPQAMMEDFGRSETRLTREGETAFGYRLARIEDGGVTLERDGRAYRLALGENKSDGSVGPERGARGGGGGSGDAFGSSATLTVASLPENLQRAVSRLLPAGGEFRVRITTVDGQEAYRVDTKVNGLDHQVQLGVDGRVLRRESEVRNNDIPAHIQSAAVSALPGYSINLNDTPTYRERNGQRYFQMEMIPANGGKKIDINIAPDGTVLGPG